MSQNPNEQGYFTHLLNPNSSYQQESGSNPSTPSSQHSQSSSSFQQYPGFVDENEEEEEPIRQCARWTREEEILLTECWIKTSENGQIRADRSKDSFWGQIMDDFNTDLRRKLQAGTSAYEAKKAKEMAMIRFKRMHTGNLAEKDATEKSDAAREAFLAELALEFKKGTADISKHSNNKLKDKIKSMEHTKT
ncbi:hypothetical protein Tco_0764856, partial [Tanacetum coccineum]